METGENYGNYESMFQIGKAVDFTAESCGYLRFVIDILNKGCFDNDFFCRVWSKAKKTAPIPPVTRGFKMSNLSAILFPNQSFTVSRFTMGYFQSNKIQPWINARKILFQVATLRHVS